MKKNFLVPPAVLIGILVIMTPVFVLMTMDRLRRQEEFFKQKLLEKGVSLIRTFEAGTRAGMFGMRWGAQRIQALLTETAIQPDVLYLMITTREGRILAHSDDTSVGKIYTPMPQITFAGHDPSGAGHRILSGNKKEEVFEVYKRFVPNHHKRMHGPGRMHRLRKFMDGGRHMDRRGDREHDWSLPYLKFRDKDMPMDAEHYIIAGLSMETVRTAGSRLVKRTVFQGIVNFLFVCAGVMTVFAFQSYRSARASLNRMKRYSDTVIQNMPAGLVTTDNNGRVTAMNAAAKAIFGSGMTEIHPRLKRLVAGVGNDTRALVRELSLDIEPDKTIRLDLTVSGIQNNENERVGFLFLFKDLTRLKELARQVETNKRLAAIGKLAAGVAHEIRNPLSSIKGFATYFGKRYEDNETDRETARIMVKEVERINRSITQLLEFAKPMSIEKSMVDIQNVIDHSLKLVRPDMDKKMIRTHVDIQLNQPRLFTDGDRLNQVLLNLYMNAVEALDRNGTLEIRASDTGTGQVEIRVCDNGRGMDAETQERIFEPYFTTRATGTGLGLSIVHRIMENLGGVIDVDSARGRGTCFYLFLPAGEKSNGGQG